MNKRKAVRREMDEEAFRQELEQGVLQPGMLSARFPSLGITLRTDTVERDLEAASAEKNQDPEAAPLVVPLNLFV
jgi:hypothetical protein